MKNLFSTLFIGFLLITQVQVVYAADNPPVNPASSVLDIFSGIPWGLILIFVIAGFIVSYMKRNNPNQVTNNTCLPLIDEAQQAREKAQIALEESEK